MASVTTGGTAMRRDLGLLDAIGIGFGAIVGAGIFVVTGMAAEIAGPSLLVGLLLAGIAAGANALSSAQLAAAYPQAGGAYEYGYRMLSPWAGFVAGWMFLVSKIAAAGTVALGLAGYLGTLVPGVPPRGVAVAAILLFTALNYVGVRRSSRVNLMVVVVSIGALATFVVAGAGDVRIDRFQPFAPAGIRGVLESAALLFFAYTGYARIATLAEEVRDPARVIPIAIGVTIVGAVILYLVTAAVALGAAGASALAETSAPLYVAALTSSGRGTAFVVSVGGVAAMLGVILSQLLALSRTTLAMARRGDLPGWLEHVHPRYAVPGRAVIVVGVLCALTAATGALQSVAATASFAILVYYGIANAAALRMPASLKRYGNTVPVVGLASCALLAFSLSAPVVSGGLAILAAGLIARWIGRRPQ
jgi:APA family basic amino acid/polyamine antiporter